MQSSSASIAGGVPIWDTAVNVSDSSVSSYRPQLGASADGQVSVGVWYTSDGSNNVIQAAVGTRGGATPPTPPAPAVPAGLPTDVVGVAGDASASVRWAAPASTGSFPITNYQVMSSPSGGMCLSTVLACEVTGLRNGTGYTFTVRALTGAGWGSSSDPSVVVIPQRPVTPSITITGMRTEVRGTPGVVVTGTTTGFEMGAMLRPWTRFPGQTSYTQGAASILVDARGGFTWERRTGKTIYISIRSDDAAVESNRLILRRA